MLCWLFEKLDPALKRPPTASPVLSSEVLLRHGIAVGICTQNDKSLVEGSAPEMEQVEFLKVLVELVELATQFDSSSLENELSRDRSLLGAIAREDLDSIFSSKCQLLPPDILKECNVENIDSLESLEQTIATLQAQLKALDAKLEVPDKGSSSDQQRSPSRHQVRTLPIFLDTCLQQMEDLVRSVTSRLVEQPTSTEQPQNKLYGIGQTLVAVKDDLHLLNHMFEEVDELLKAFADLKSLKATAALDHLRT